MIIGIHGYLGSLKTTTAALLAELSREEGYTIVSNQPLTIPYIDLNMDIIRIYAILGMNLPWDKVFILGDEWQQVMDSRRAMDGDELINTYFIAQTRKRYVKLCYITSQRGMNDLRLRDNTNIIFKCYKRHKENKSICFNDECERPHYAEWYIINVQAGKGIHKYCRNPEIAFKLFDTRHIISPIAQLDEKDKAIVKNELMGKIEEYERTVVVRSGI